MTSGLRLFLNPYKKRANNQMFVFLHVKKNYQCIYQNYGIFIKLYGAVKWKKPKCLLLSNSSVSLCRVKNEQAGRSRKLFSSQLTCRSQCVIWDLGWLLIEHHRMNLEKKKEGRRNTQKNLRKRTPKNCQTTGLTSLPLRFRQILAEPALKANFFTKFCFYSSLGLVDKS